MGAYRLVFLRRERDALKAARNTTLAPVLPTFNLVVGRPPLELAGDDLADLARDVALRDQAIRERHVDLAVGAALADVVDEDTRALEDARVELLIAALVGADRGDVRTGRDPLVDHDRAPRRRDRDDDVGAANDGLEVGRGLQREREPAVVLGGESVER